MLGLDCFGRLKWLATGFDLSVSFFPMLWRNVLVSNLPFSYLLHLCCCSCKVYWLYNGWRVEVQVKQSLILDCLGAEILSILCIRRFPVGKSCWQNSRESKCETNLPRKIFYCMTANLIGLRRCFSKRVWWHFL